MALAVGAVVMLVAERAGRARPRRELADGRRRAADRHGPGVRARCPACRAPARPSRSACCSASGARRRRASRSCWRSRRSSAAAGKEALELRHMHPDAAPADAVRRRRGGLRRRRLRDDQVFPAVPRRPPPRRLRLLSSRAGGADVRLADAMMSARCATGSDARLRWLTSMTDDCRLTDDSDCRLPTDMLQWLRRSFIAGFFVTVPLVISVAAFVWIFRLIDGFVGPFYAALARARGAGPRHPDDGAGGAAGRRAGHQRDRQAAAAAGGELPAARAGVPHDLRAGQAAGRGVLARQRVRLQARGAWSRTGRAGSCSGS